MARSASKHSPARAEQKSPAPSGPAEPPAVDPVGPPPDDPAGSGLGVRIALWLWFVAFVFMYFQMVLDLLFGLWRR